jgi:superfamily I DNA/RNA helicase/RecB family exonuclease
VGVRYLLDRTPPPPAVVPVLDDAQQQVVDHRGGPLLVLAGPGTGKTTTLVEAVVDRVERDGVPPDQVLVLTFSRKAAGELRERITTRLARTVSEPAAYTFHSWCFGVVRAYDSPGSEPPRLLSGAERDVRVHELLKGNAEGEGKTRWPAALSSAVRLRGFAREVADLLDRARERGLTAEDLRRLGSESDRPAWVAAGDFLDEYLEVLDSRNELDYAGLVARARAVLDDPAVGPDVAGRYRAVFVDEYQDTDPAQEGLLQRLAGAGRELVVVGDPDQSIYAFRGADVRNILDFPDRFRTATGQPARTIALRRSRRAGSALLAASREVARRIPVGGAMAPHARAHRDLEAVAPGGPAPEVRLYPTVAEEVTGIADLLRRAHLEDGLPWSEMAVLVRSGVRSIPVLRRAFTTAGVPVSVAADEVVLAKDPTVAPLLLALRVADEGWGVLDSDGALRLLTSPLGRASASGLRALGRRLRALARNAGERVPPPSEDLVRAALCDPADLSTVEDWVAGPVRRLHDLLAAARTAAAAGAAPEEILWLLWDRSGWGRRLAAASGGGGDAAHVADRELDAVLALFEAAGRLEDRRPRAGVGALLDEITAQQLPAGQLEERPGATDAVRLLTAHRSKGLEWSLVVVSGVQDGVWPDLRRRGTLLDPDRLDAAGPREPATGATLLADERRLFYVACTRARHRLVVTAVSSLDDEGERPSRFVEELGVVVPALGGHRVVRHPGTDVLAVHSLVARLRQAVQGESTSPALQAAAAAELARLATATDDSGQRLVASADPASWWGLADPTPGAAPVRPLDEPVALSGSGVAAFERCPLRWFLEREVGARGESTVSQSFGTVVHALAQAVADGELPADEDTLVAALDSVWDRLGFAAPWQEEREREQAREVLRGFLGWHAANSRTVLASEVTFDVVVDQARLRGAVDRLEQDAAGALHVIDLKTSKHPPTEDELRTDPQLGVYQIVARSGALTPDRSDPALGGAALVQLRALGRGGLPKVQVQDALPGLPPTWADELVARVVSGVRAEEFPARPNDTCGRCAFRSSCPAQDDGRQVLPWA